MSRILFEIVADQTNIGVALEELRARVKQLNKEISQGNNGAQRNRELREELVKAKSETARLTDEQRKLNREFKATQVPKDSLAGLRLEYARLTDQLSRLSKAERESKIGQGLISNAAGIKQQIDQIEQSVGRFTGNVGNYRSALLSVGDLLTGGLITGGVIVGVEKLAEVMKIGTAQALAYEQALDDLSALTGLTGQDLAGLEEVAKRLQTINIEGVEIVNTGPEVLNALKLVGGAQPELLKDAEALGEVTRQAIILSKASGDGLEPSVVALTTVLGQFKASASESARIINELAAGAKEGASEIPDTTEALQKFGTVAKIANVSTGESIALIELLADRQLKGAEAGTQLRNVLTKLAGADVLPKAAQDQFRRLGIDINVLKDDSLSLDKRLQELAKANGDLAALTKAFGLENLQAATIITSGIPKYLDLQKKIEGTNEALVQAQIRSDNANTSFENLKNRGLNQLQEAFSNGTPVARGLADAFSVLLDRVNLVQGAFNLAIGPITTVVDGITDSYNRLVSFFSDDQPVNQEWLQRAKVQFDGLGGSIDEATFGADALTKSIVGGSRKRQEELDTEVQKMVLLGQTEPTIKGLTDRIKDLKKELGTTSEGTEKFTRLSGELKAAQAELSRLKKEAGFTNVKAESDAAAGSVAALQKEVQRLQDQLNRTAPTDKGFGLLVTQLDAAQAALKEVQASIERIRTGGRARSAAKFFPTGGDDTAPDLTTPADFAADEKAAADRRRQEKEKAREAEIEDQREYQDRLFQINKQAAEEEQAFRKKTQENEEKDNEERRQRNLDIATETGAAVASAIFEIERNRLDRQTSQALTALDEEYQRRIELATGNAALQEKLQKEQEKKRLQIEKTAAKERQNIAIKQALIQGALNALKAYFTEGIAGAIEAAALTLLQVATIKSQSFARGGVVKMGIFKGRPHSQGGTKGVFSDGTRVEVEKDEAFVVVNKRNTPLLRHLSNVNAAGGHGTRFFAGGGAIDFTPQIALPRASGASVQVQAEAGFSEEQTIALGKTIGVLVAREVANQIQPALANGLNDANRRTEREKALKTNQTV